MSRHDKEIVPALRAALAERIGEKRFALWFGTRIQFQVAEQTVRVTATERFFLDRVRSQFRNEVLAVCLELLPDHAVEFQLDSARVAPRHNSAATPAPVKAGGRVAAREESPKPAPVAGSQRPRVKLEDFVVGDCNRLAYTGAQTLVRRPGQVSPFFVYGPTGCGKTVLLDGIATSSRLRGLRRVISLSAEHFTSLFLEALQGSGLPSFRRKYRDVELLLIDDLQFFCGKRATIVELLHTVDSLLRDGRQLVLAADRSPAELTGFGDELVARISGGLVCGIEYPDEITRLSIVRRLNKQLGLAVPEPVLQYVAQQVAGDARQLAGALNRVHATSEALARPLTLALAETALADIVRSTRRIVRLTDIESAVCDVFGVDVKSLQSDRKSRLLSQPRMLAMWLARKYTRAAFSEIGEYFGGRSHSTVISAHKKVDGWVAGGTNVDLAYTTCPIADAIRRVEARLRAG